jgi:hypothetical protein
LVVIRDVEAAHGQLGGIGRDPWMTPRELRAIGVGGLMGQQRACACVVEARVVEHDQAGVSEEIRPEELVQPRVAGLVDDEIVLSAGDAPHRVVRALDAHAARRGGVATAARDGDAALVGEDVEAVSARGERGHQFRRPATPLGSGGHGVNHARRIATV